MKRFLYSLKGMYSAIFQESCLKILVAVIIAATVASALACVQDEELPIIKQYEMPEWVVEDENIDLKVNTFDNQKTRKVYIQFQNGDVIDLTKTHSKQIESGEESIWEAKDLKLPPEKYSFQIVARDSVNFSEPKTVNITVYPYDEDGDGIGYRDELKYDLDVNKKNPVSKYLLDKNLGIYIPVFTYLENDEWMNDSEKSFIDLAITYHPKISQILPEFYNEIVKLPDLSTIEEKDVEAIEDIFILASNPQYKTVFESMLSVGIKDKRKYCSPLEALLWEAYDDKTLSDFLGPYSMEKLIKDAWKNTHTSNNYWSAKWKEFDEVVDRLNSPELATIYCLDNFSYDSTLGERMKAGVLFWPAQKTFNDKKGACIDQAGFVLNCIIHNGYICDDFNIPKNNTACVLSARPGLLEPGHSVCLYVQDDKLYIADLTWKTGIHGPFKTVKDAADFTWPGWNEYWILNADAKLINRYKK